jgi:predicted alpha/beta-hydrolase family hydrolase
MLGRSSARTVVLGHGASGGVEADDLQALAVAISATGRRVILVEQPWRVAGRRVAPRPQVLDVVWEEVLTSLALGRFVAGGRSAGARVACRTAARLGAVGVLALAFPLHPPGRPERSRAHELATGVPTLVIQGTRDAFGSPDEVRLAAPTVEVEALGGADHALRVPPRSPADPLRRAAEAAVRFLDRIGE